MNENWLSEVRSYYLEDRRHSVDNDFLAFEEEMINQEDQQRLLNLLCNRNPGLGKLSNPHNSILLYITGLSDDFDFKTGRADTIGGSPPDIDIDFDAVERQKAIDWVINHWGRDQVVNIITHGTFKPKSLTDKFFSINSPNPEGLTERQLEQHLLVHARLKKEIKDKIPDALFGIEAKLIEVLEGNEDKNYPAHPELVEDEKYAPWLTTARKLEHMVWNFGIHAGGIIISDKPVSDIVPVWYKEDKEEQPNGKKKTIKKWISQWDMSEVEELGLIKFDFLGIDNLSIIKEACRLIEERHGIVIDPYKIEDGDEKTYKLMAAGLLTGLFQMETSGSAKRLIQKIEPTSWGELSDISAINRPGPLEAGYDEQYYDNKNKGYAPSNMPEQIAEILKDTHWTMIYQEQVMRITSELAGFTLQESDDVRRAMGKKKESVLVGYKNLFINGCIEHNLTKEYASTLWEDLIGFSKYGFNKSHSLAYSVITYVCAWLKAHYPLEFFCALMSIRSQSLQPKTWAEKAPEYIAEASHLGVNIHAPAINTSEMGFSIINDEIYFGLSAIRDVGRGAARNICRVRGKKKYSSINDFIQRVDLNTVNSKKFKALIMAGTFDRLGYDRQTLLKNADALYKYVRDTQDYHERIAENKQREIENVELERKITLRNELRKIKSRKRDRDLTQDEEEFLELTKGLRKKTILKVGDKPAAPDIPRTKHVTLDVVDLMLQAEYIGCYIGVHPARVVYPGTTKISNAYEGTKQELAGVVSKMKVIRDRNRNQMAFIEFGDGSGIAEGVIFARTFSQLVQSNQLPKVGELVKIYGTIDSIDPQVNVKVFGIDTYRSNK